MRQVDQAFLVQSRRAQSRGMTKQTIDALQRVRKLVTSGEKDVLYY